MAERAPIAAGYSGTPLWRKLGLKTGMTVLLRQNPDGWRVPEAPEGIVWLDDSSETRDGVDVVIAFFANAGEYAQSLGELGEVIRPSGIAWVAWPRKAAGHVSDLSDNVVRDTALPLGLVDVKVAALDEDWSALKFVWRKELR
jgi:hypothetical protein